MEGKEMNGFESLMRTMASGAAFGGIGFDRVSECITEVDLASVRLTANVVMPYSGMGIFYFGVPQSSEMSVDKLPKSMDAVKKLKFFKLNYCVSGRVEVYLKGKGKYAYLEEGMVAFDKNDTGTVLSFTKDDYVGFGLYFNFDMMSDDERQILHFFGITKERATALIERDEACFLGNASPEFRNIVESLMARIDDRTIDLEYARLQVTRLVFLLLNDDVIPLGKSEYTTAGQRRLAEEAEKLILENTAAHLTAEDIAERLGCTAPTLKKYFRKVYGMPMYSYLQDIRMKKAAEDIKGTYRSIADIAYEAGYQNQSKFCSLFKKTYGVTPTEYRRLNP